MGRASPDTDLRNVRGRSLLCRLNSATVGRQSEADENGEETKHERFHLVFITLFPGVVNEGALRWGAVAAKERRRMS